MPSFPGQPPRPLNSRRLFVVDTLDSARAKFPLMTREEAEKFLLDVWRRHLTCEEKQPYEAASRALRFQWRDACLEFQRRMREADGKGSPGELGASDLIEGRMLASQELRSLTLPGLNADVDTCACLRCRVVDRLWALDAAATDNTLASLPKDENLASELCGNRRTDLRRQLSAREAKLRHRLTLSSDAAPPTTEPPPLPRPAAAVASKLQSLGEDLLDLMQDAEQLMGRQRGEECLYVPP
uniref:HMG box domain-containing protein n=1 Tax=Phaeomonas parva TaxID=124430 RepID=A0A7S1XYJ2_9STRA|mmetsp:Transcript_44587/g.139837  ORF Transcript_44587/g.139837 Transcript_44587/m.139837 type:complete len:241 (+) Transcript_44587:92-814(+)